MQPAHLDLRIQRGVTWRKQLSIMQPDYAYKAIQSINKTAPLTITVEHAMPDGVWPIWIEGSTSSSLNSDKSRERFRMARIIDEQTIELNDINGTNLRADGGVLVYQLPVDFTGCTASMVFDSAGETLELTDADGLELGIGSISATLTSEQTVSLGENTSYALWVTHTNADKIKWLCGEVIFNDCKNASTC